MRIKGVVGMGVLTGLMTGLVGVSGLSGVMSLGCKSPEKPLQTGPTQAPAPKVEPIDPVVDPIVDAGEATALRRGGGPAKPIAVPPGAKLELAAFDRARVEELAALAFEPEVRSKLCILPKRKVEVGEIDVDRALFVHDRATLDALGPDGFSLMRTLKQIAGDAVAAGATGATPEALFRDLWDTQNKEAEAATPEGAHCDDDGTTLNGFPNACRAAEGQQAKGQLAAEIASYRAVGLVNRLDLAAEGWKNCGEHRIIYGREAGPFPRSFIIFEAVLPNPRPGCQSGCRAVAEHWQALSKVSDPKERAQRLETFFYKGLPGFRPVVHVDHYAARGTSSRYGSSGSGQIRTNQFLQSPWMLKEFKLALDCTSKPCKLDPVPIPVKVNPDGNLWTESLVGLARDFQQKVVLEQVDRLAIDDLNLFSYQVPVAFDAARSDSQSRLIQDHYFEAYSATAGQPGGFREQLRDKAGATSPRLTDAQLVNRAMALSCAGCHQPNFFGLNAANSVAAGKSWPNSAGFVHVRAEAQPDGVHALSPALTQLFLPFRAQNLASFLNEKSCACRFRGPGKPPRLAPDRKAQPLVLDEVRAAGSDEGKRAAARRKAVQKLVAEEPPRRTVTGSFRTH